MPKQYEAIRDKFAGQGMPLAEAKTRAAKIFNARRPEGAAPVTRLGDMAADHVKHPPRKRR